MRLERDWSKLCVVKVNFFFLSCSIAAGLRGTGRRCKRHQLSVQGGNRVAHVQSGVSFIGFMYPFRVSEAVLDRANS